MTWGNPESLCRGWLCRPWQVLSPGCCAGYVVGCILPWASVMPLSLRCGRRAARPLVRLHELGGCLHTQYATLLLAPTVGRNASHELDTPTMPQWGCGGDSRAWCGGEETRDVRMAATCLAGWRWRETGATRCAPSWCMVRPTQVRDRKGVVCAHQPDVRGGEGGGVVSRLGRWKRGRGHGLNGVVQAVLLSGAGVGRQLKSA